MASCLGRGRIVSLSPWICRISFSVLESWGFTDKHWEFLVEPLLLPEVNVLNYLARSFIQFNILVMLYTLICGFIMKLNKDSGICASKMLIEVGKIERIIWVHSFVISMTLSQYCAVLWSTQAKKIITQNKKHMRNENLCYSESMNTCLLDKLVHDNRNKPKYCISWS